MKKLLGVILIILTNTLNASEETNFEKFEFFISESLKIEDEISINIQCENKSLNDKRLIRRINLSEQIDKISSFNKDLKEIYAIKSQEDEKLFHIDTFLVSEILQYVTVLEDFTVPMPSFKKINIAYSIYMKIIEENLFPKFEAITTKEDYFNLISDLAEETKNPYDQIFQDLLFSSLDNIDYISDYDILLEKLSKENQENLNLGYRMYVLSYLKLVQLKIFNSYLRHSESKCSKRRIRPIGRNLYLTFLN